MNTQKGILRRDKGISIVSLIITIIVLLILAFIALGNLGTKNSTIKAARDAKIKSEVASERRVVANAATTAATKNKRGFITKEGLEKSLRNYTDKTSVEEKEEEFIVTFEDTNRSYLVDKFGDAEYIEGALISANPKSNKIPSSKVKTEISLIITVDEVDEIKIEYGITDNKDTEPDTYINLSTTKDSDANIWRGNVEDSVSDEGEYYIHAKATVDGEEFEETFGPYVVSNTIVAKQITSAVLRKTVYNFDNTEKTPEAIVKAGDIVLTEDEYDITYTDNINPGTAVATITGKGEYTGTITRTFDIIPKGTSLKKLTAGSKQFKVKWKAQKTETKGTRRENN